DDFSIKGEVIDALEHIEDRAKGKNIVEAHMVEAVDVHAGVVDITITVERGRAREERFALEDSIYDAVEAIAGVQEVKIKSMSPEAIERDQTSDAPSPTPAPKPAPSTPAAPSPPRQAAVPASAPVEGVGKVIAVASGKGGVGKSTVAVNLALGLAHEGSRVGLLDIDIYGPSLPTLLGVADRPGVRERRIMPLDVAGLKLMSLGFLMEEDTPVIWRGPIVTGIIRQFLRDVDWSGIDYLVIDMPPGTGDAQLALAQTVPVDGALIVSTPSELALVDAARGLQMFKTLNIDVLGIVSNMSKFVTPDGAEHYIFGRGTVEREAERLETEMLGEIPLDQNVREGGDAGKPIVLQDPQHPVSQAFIELAKRVAALRPLGAPDEEPKKKGLFSFLKS
ncbi:MAG: Mrp/NBP35 family ATP-binding protein, partial [Myxococcota bacterium]